jgi:hypothetical protein
MKARIVQALVLLSASAAAQAQFNANPEAYLHSVGLNAEERQLVLTCSTESIREGLGDTQSVALNVQSPF